jgi:hypothetical protein
MSVVKQISCSHPGYDTYKKHYYQGISTDKYESFALLQRVIFLTLYYVSDELFFSLFFDG